MESHQQPFRVGTKKMGMWNEDVQRTASQYMEYLNGPLGRNVMAHLKEGESCTIKAHDKTLQITREEGKAIVKIVNSITENGILNDNI